MMCYVNVCFQNIISVLHHMPAHILDLLTQRNTQKKLHLLPHVIWLNVSESWGQLDAFSRVLFGFDNLRFSICQEGLSPSL